MSTPEDKSGSKPFDSEYYGWSHRINESRKVGLTAILVMLQELEKLGVDITPNKIEGASPVGEKTEAGGLSTSAWNGAGTWYKQNYWIMVREERNLTKWAKKRIPEILESFNAEKNGVSF